MKHIILSYTIILMLCGSVHAQGPNVLKYRIESRGGPTTVYNIFANTSYIFKAGDTLEYDVYTKNRTPGIGNLDITTRQSMRFRDFSPKDQNGISAGPKADISKVAYGKWYHRKIAIPSALIGEESAEWLVAANGIYETGEVVECAYRNVSITNKGRTVFSIYNGGSLSRNQIISATEATLESAVLVSIPFGEKIRTTLDWWNSTLPPDKYIGMHAEKYDFEKKLWVSACPTMQPFKTSVFKPWNVAFWRKDDMQSFYGEIFTYDLTTLRLHTETMPSPWPHEMETHPAWDARPDRSRLFVQTPDGCQNWAVGRAIAPVDGSTDWQFHGTLNTYIANNYDELNNGTVPLIQLGVNDYVTITRIKNFSCVYEGEADGWKAEPEFKRFDEVLVINQHMNDNGGRERFIFARNGDKYLGLVRWDNSEMRGGKWVVNTRATGLKLMTAEGGFSFAGMYDRVKNDRWIGPRDLDMSVPNPSAVPRIMSDEVTFSILNTGRRTWKASETALYGVLTDAAWKPVPGGEVKLCTVAGDVGTLDSCTVRFTVPSEWKPGTYFVQFTMKDGDTWFSKSGSIPFVKKVEIAPRP